MKRTLLFCSTILLLVFVGCSKDEDHKSIQPTLTIEKDLYEYLNTDKTDEIEVTVTGDLEWTVEMLTDEFWFSAVKKDDKVEITMDENERIYERVAKFRINTSDEKLNKIVVVKQHGTSPTLIVNETALLFEKEGGDGIIEIKSNMDWSLSTPIDWLTWEQEGDKVTLIIEPNENPEGRSAVVKINAEATVFNQSISIRQKGTVSYEIDKESIEFDRDAGTEEIQVTSDVEWTYQKSENSDWFTVQRQGSKLTVRANQNDLGERSGSVTIELGAVKVVIPVRQESFELSRDKWTATASVQSNDAIKAIDGDPTTRWASGGPQVNGQYFILDMNAINGVSKIILDNSQASQGDFPKGYEVYMSDDGEDWGDVLASGVGDRDQTVISFGNTEGRYIKVVQTGEAGNYWSIQEFRVFGKAKKYSLKSTTIKL